MRPTDTRFIRRCTVWAAACVPMLALGQAPSPVPSSTNATSNTNATANANAPAPASSASAAAGAASAPGRVDRAELERTQIIGNRELPRVLYIVPWKKPVQGQLEKPVKSLVDEVFAPIDREVLQRQIHYDRQLRAAMATGATAPAVPKQAATAATPASPNPSAGPGNRPSGSTTIRDPARTP